MINKIGLILGIIGLALSVLWGYMYYNNKSLTRELIKKGEQTLAMVEEAAKLKQDSIAAEVNKRDSVISDLTLAQKESKESLNHSLREGKRLAAEVRRARVEEDTPSYYVKCDSLSDQIAVLEIKNQAFQEKVDSLNLSYRKQLVSKDSMLRSKDELYANLRTAFTGSTLKIHELDEKNKQLILKLEKSKRATRLVAVLGALAAGTIYVTSR